jgi:cytosine/uracil/thiamine/allantoin permease
VKIVFLVFLGILALNALAIVSIVGILVLDQWKVRRRRTQGEAPADDAPAKAS